MQNRMTRRDSFNIASKEFVMPRGRFLDVMSPAENGAVNIGQ